MKISLIELNKYKTLNGTRSVTVPIMIVIEIIIEKHKHLLNGNEKYYITTDYIHCDNLAFLKAVQRETGGHIEDCTNDEFGYYLVFD